MGKPAILRTLPYFGGLFICRLLYRVRPTVVLPTSHPSQPIWTDAVLHNPSIACTEYTTSIKPGYTPTCTE